MCVPKNFAESIKFECFALADVTQNYYRNLTTSFSFFSVLIFYYSYYYRCELIRSADNSISSRSCIICNCGGRNGSIIVSYFCHYIISTRREDRRFENIYSRRYCDAKKKRIVKLTSFHHLICILNVHPVSYSVVDLIDVVCCVDYW